MCVLILAVALFQPAPAQSAAPAPVPTQGALPETTPAGRMPAGALQIARGDIVVRNSGSTNSPGYEIVIHPDDSADVSLAGTISHGVVGKPQADWLRARIAEAPLDQLSAEHCMKSMSFGTSTTLEANGLTSPDLSCGGGPRARELMRTVGVITNQLDVKPGFGRGRGRLRLL